ncbi:MAG TPA: helix-turn-helix domain-containing protein [Pseudonocardiaceae bacterium]|nr:helix-turn-helix domain-containing protein [Pseudonocardiaceae bacterium]
MQGSHDVQQPPLRADARRNREQIIEAARELFIRFGTDVPMEDIAKAAGVGVGTLYRRFPDRDELIKAVSLDNFVRLLEIARRIERDETDAAEALSKLLHSSLELRLGMTLTAVSARTYESIQRSLELSSHRGEVLAIATRLLHRAQQDGTLRKDIEIGDVVLALVLVSRLIPPSDSDLGEMVFQRLVAMMMDGLRATAKTELPGRPVTYDDIEALRLAGFGKLGPHTPPR